MEDRIQSGDVGRPLRVLIVDDSVIFRTIVAEALRDVPWIEIIGSAPDGERALEKIPSAAPDVLTLDLEMPRMDGLSLLQKLREHHPKIATIILSAYTAEGSREAVEALEAGAFDCLQKPEAESLARSAELLRRELVDKLLAFRTCRAGASRPGRSPSQPQAREGARMAAGIVALAASTGGPRALATVLARLPADLAAPVLIVQHIPAGFTATLAKSLARKGPLRVRVAEAGDRIEPGTALLAPGDIHMKVAESEDPGGGLRIALSDEPPENGCRPSADCLFRSLAAVCGRRTVAVVLTGMGRDGLLGARLLKRKGAAIFAEDPSTAVAWGMPRSIVEAGLADRVLPLEEIAQGIVASTRRT